MPQATPMAKRQQLIEQYLSGKSIRQIAASSSLSYGTVWTLCQRYKQSGMDGLMPGYSNCGPPGPKCDPLIYRAVRCLKTWHPGWGGGRIHALLGQKYKDKPLPSIRTMQRWFKANGQVKAKSKQPQLTTRWARSVHEVWQIDAKEEVKLASGQKVCWLNIEDEYSSGIIDALVFPLG